MTTLSLGTLVVYMVGRNADYLRSMAAVASSTDTTMGKLTEVTKKTAVLMTAAMGFIGVAAVREFGKFDEAMVHSLAILGDVSAGVREQMEGVARTIAKSSTQSAAEVAGAYQGLASAGLNAQQSMASLAAVERFAVAGQIDMNRSVLMLTDSVGALGLASQNAAEYSKNLLRVSDVLAAGANISQASVEELALALQGKVAGGLRLVNKSVEEGVATLGAFAKAGIKGLDASEKFSQVLRDLQVSALKQPQTWKDFGLSVFDATGNMRNFADIVQDLERQLAPLTSEEKRQTLTMLGFQDRSVSAMQALLGFSGTIREYEKALKEAGGTTAKMAAIQMTSLNAQMTELWHKVQDVLITMGQGLAPVITMLIRNFDELTFANAKFNDGLSNSDRYTKAFGRMLGMVADIVYGLRGAFIGVKLIIDFLSLGIAIALKGIEVAFYATGIVIQKGTGDWVQSIVSVMDFLGMKVNETFRKIGTDSMGDALKQARIELKILTDNTRLPIVDEIEALIKQLDKMGQAGRPSVAIMAELNRILAENKKATAAADEEFTVAKMDMDAFKDSALRLGGTLQGVLHPSLQQFRIEAHDPLFNQDMVTKLNEWNRALNHGLPVAEYTKAMRDLVAQTNQFVAPVKGIKEMTGIQGIDDTSNIDNEMKLLQDQYNRKIQAHAQYLDALGVDEKTARKAQEEFMQETYARYLARQAVFERQKQLLILKQAEDLFGQLADVAKEGFGEQSGAYKAMFAISKAFAIAQAMISMQVAIAKALELGPLGIPAMLSAAAQGANIIAAVQAVALSFEGGGFTPRGSRSGGVDGRGGFMAVMHPNEQVIDLTREPGAAGGGLVIHQHFHGGVTQADLAQWSQKTKQEAMAGTLQGIKRGGDARRTIRR